MKIPPAEPLRTSTVVDPPLLLADGVPFTLGMIVYHQGQPVDTGHKIESRELQLFQDTGWCLNGIPLSTLHFTPREWLLSELERLEAKRKALLAEADAIIPQELEIARQLSEWKR